MRRYHDMVSIPGLGKFPVPLPDKSLIIGSALGLAGALGLKWAIKKYPSIAVKVPVAVQDWLPAVGGLVAGAAGYFAFKKGGKGAAYAAGAVAAGLVVQAYTLVMNKYADKFAGIVDYRLAGFLVSDAQQRMQGFGGYGLLQADARPMLNGYAGASASNLAELAGYGTDDAE